MTRKFVLLLLVLGGLTSVTFAQTTSQWGCMVDGKMVWYDHPVTCASSSSSSSSAGTPAVQSGAYRAGYALGQGLFNWLFSSGDNGAAAQREAFMQEMERQRQDAARHHNVEEAEHLQAMYDRLTAAMKLNGLPDLHLKGIDANPGGGLQLKLGDQSQNQGDGISGLPGEYIGGARDGRTSNGTQESLGPNLPESGGLKLKLGEGSATVSNGGGGPGASGPGIPGLPGTYTGGSGGGKNVPVIYAPANESSRSTGNMANISLQPVDTSDFKKITPEQATSLAKQFGSLPPEQQEKMIAEAQRSVPSGGIMTPGNSPPPVMQSTTISINSQQSIATQSETPGQVQEVQVEKNSQSGTSAGTLEESSNRARNGFDQPTSTAGPTAEVDRPEAHVPPSSTIVPDQRNPSSVRDANEPLVIRPEDLKPPATEHGPFTESSVPGTAQQLRAEISGIQQALKRLSQTQSMQADERAAWEKATNDATLDAWSRGIEMATNGVTTKLHSVVDHHMKELDRDLQDTIVRRSNEADAVNRALLDGQLKKLWEDKQSLETAMRRVESVRQHGDEFNRATAVAIWAKGKPEGLEGALEGLRQLMDNTLKDPGVQKALRLTPAGTETITYATSILDSSYDIAAEAISIKRLGQLNQNSDQYLAAVKILQKKMEVTVKQLKLLEQQN